MIIPMVLSLTNYRIPEFGSLWFPRELLQTPKTIAIQYQHILDSNSLGGLFSFVTIDKISRLLCKDNSNNELVPVPSYLFEDIC